MFGRHDVPAKHPLHTGWAVIVHCGRKGRASWVDGLHPLPPFRSSEDFWAVWDAMAPPSQLPGGADYFLFREGLRPSWEAWPAGGLWQLTVPHGQQTRGGPAIDTLWLGVALALLGEQCTLLSAGGDLCDSDEVCGGSVSIRPHDDRLTIWTCTAADEPRQRHIGQRLLELVADALGLPTLPCSAEYFAHQDARRLKRGQSASPRYVLTPEPKSLGSPPSASAPQCQATAGTACSHCAS